MNSHQISIIKATAGQFNAACFYEKLWEIDPSAKELFKFTNMEEQKDKLVNSLLLVVQSVENLSKVVPRLQKLGIRHINYGVHPGHYKSVGEALLFALGLTHPDQVHAWTTAYEIIANTMIEAGEKFKQETESES